ncbi:hypothetical protein K474DRAFT_1519702 [Panus rudis PR-1116 ss-1]|nr:hypothetical protein K474DRAFT_1519702 [Panus rudis PR-1116 ss-1]
MSLHKRPSQSVFPTEIYERIIDAYLIYPELWLKRMPTLLACSVVCKAWYPRSQIGLMRQVEFLAYREKSFHYHRISCFAEVLSKKPVLQEYVLGLIVESFDDPTWIFLVIGPRLPKLRYLIVTSHCSSRVGTKYHPIARHAMFSIALSQYKSIRYLQLGQEDSSDVVTLSYLFEEPLRTTQLSALDGIFRQSPTNSHRLPLRLTSLILPQYEVRLLNHLCSTVLKQKSTLSYLQRLSIPFASRNGLDRQQLYEFLGECHAVEELILIGKIKFSHYNDERTEPLDLCLTHLRDLRKIFFLNVSAFKSAQGINHVIKLLASVTSSKLERVEIDFCTTTRGVLYQHSFPWKELEDVLIRLPLRTLLIHASAKSEMGNLDLAQRLPRLNTRCKVVLSTSSYLLTRYYHYWRHSMIHPWNTLPANSVF